MNGNIVNLFQNTKKYMEADTKFIYIYIYNTHKNSSI